MPASPLVLRRATAHLKRVDPVLAGIIRSVGPCRLRVDRCGGPFGALVESIIYQQITGRAAATIHGRLCALFENRHLCADDILGASDDALRQAGLSRQKVAALRDLSRRVKSGLPLRYIARLPDERVIEALTEVRGIGRWTVEMFLIFRLGRLDVLPVDDYGVRKAMQRAYRKRALPKGEWMTRVAEPWRPYRSVASWYLWRSLDGAA